MPDVPERELQFFRRVIEDCEEQIKMDEPMEEERSYAGYRAAALRGAKAAKALLYRRLGINLSPSQGGLPK